MPIKLNYIIINPNFESYNNLTNIKKKKYKFLINKYYIALNKHNIL